MATIVGEVCNKHVRFSIFIRSVLENLLTDENSPRDDADQLTLTH